MTDRLILILLAMALLCSFAACGCGDDDDDDDAGGDGGEQFCDNVDQCGLVGAFGFDSLDACLDYFAGLGDDAQACVAAAGNCDELENCFDLGDDDDDDDDSVGPECVDEPTIVDDDWPDPPLTDNELYEQTCPDADDPTAAEEVTLQWSSDEWVTGSVAFQAGTMEGIMVRPEHPFHVKSIDFYFYKGCGEAAVRVVPDLLGSAFVRDEDLMEPVHVLIPEEAGWVNVPVRDGNFLRYPADRFWVLYEHTDASPVLGQDGGDNTLLTSRFYDEQWAQDNSPFKYGAPAHNYMIRVHGNYVCKKTEDWFTDVTVDVGLGPDLHRQRTVWTDIDNDGWDDVLVSTGGYDENGFSVFLNDEGDFTDITGASGVNGFGAGVALPADFDNDGNVDLYLGVNTPEQNTLDYYSTILLGDGAGQFTEVPSNGVDVMFEVNLGGETVMHRPSHVAAAAADYDGDGIVDIYTGNWEIEYPIGTAYPDQLFQGAGDGTFANVSDASGVTANKGAAYGVAWWDYDNDGDQDVATANYGGQFNYLWENQGDGTFVNASSDHNFGVAGDGKGGTSFGHDFGDIDNDGDLDAYESTIQHPRFEGVTGGSTMHLSSGAPDFDFTDVTGTLGIHRDEGEIDGSFADFDNDGRLDLFLSDLYTGHYGRLLRQNEDGTFTDVTYFAGINMHDCTNHAWADYDRDGDLDLLVTRRSDGQQVHLWRNDVGQDNNWATFRLVGDGSASNTLACGARVTLVSGDLTQIREVQCGRGHATSQPSIAVEFGLGARTTIDSVSVDWPGGTNESWDDPPIKRFILLEQGNGSIGFYDE